MAKLKCWFISFALIAIIGGAIATPETEVEETGTAATWKAAPTKELTDVEKAAMEEEARLTNLEKSRSCEVQRSRNDAAKNFLGAIFCRSEIATK